MGSKICTPSPEKLSNENSLESFDPQQSISIPVKNNNESNHSSQQLEQFEEGEDYDDNQDHMELDLPQYQAELVFSRLPLLHLEQGLDYHKILSKHLVRMSGWETDGEKKIILAKRVLSEIKILQKTLPCYQTNSIFVVANQNNMSQMQAIIFGSQGTPYANGAFLYTIDLLETYPNEPPKVNLETTGNQKIRFNPNLYQTGYVCLSLLGTWNGQPKQNWQPGHSNISQVLLSIQTIVMNEDVYYNQPSYEDMDRTECKGFNVAYQNIVRFGNIAYAMNQMLQNPPINFEKIIKTHFYLKKNRILETVYNWIQDNSLAEYEDLVQQHNYSFCCRYSSPWMYKNDLITELQRLYNNLLEIKRSQTYLEEDMQKQQQKKQPLVRDVQQQISEQKSEIEQAS